MQSDQTFSALAQVPLPDSIQASGPLDLLASDRMQEAVRVLKKAGLNLVGEVLKGQGTFYEMQHYPTGDVYDSASHAQYYYHAHRGSELEHGHFHLFMRHAGMPAATRLDAAHMTPDAPKGSGAIAHLVAISMDKHGVPLGMFACNRWVTGESWYNAEEVIAMLDGFEIDHAYPSWPTNLWLTSLVRLYRPQIEVLLRHRDQVVTEWQRRFPYRDVLEDRELEITGYLPFTQ